MGISRLAAASIWAPGSNSLSVSQTLSLNNGSLSLIGPTNAVTVGGDLSATGGSLVVGPGSSIVVGGNASFSGDVPLTITGCPVGGCSGPPANPLVTIDGALTNTGTLDIPPTEEDVLRGGITLQTVESAFNSGNIGMGIIDALILFGPTEVPEVVRFHSAFASGADFNNLSGGTFAVTAANDTVKVSNGNWNNNAGSALTMTGRNDTLTASGSFVNAGSVTLSGVGDNIAASSFSNSGTVSLARGTLISAGDYSQSSGSSEGIGTIQAEVTVTGGTIMPGTAGMPGALTIDGDYTQGPDGALVINIDGTRDGQFSALDVLGSASLGGQVTFDFGFTPTEGESFTFLAAGLGLSGVFDSESFIGFDCLDCTLLYGPRSVTLETGGVPAPEPASWAIMSTGVLGLAGLMRRRKAR